MEKETNVNFEYSASVRLSLSRPILALALFLSGAGIYLLFRSRQHLGFQLLDTIGLGAWADGLRERVKDLHPYEFVIYNLPDALWTCSYLLLIGHLFRNERRNKRLLWGSVIPVFGIGSELLQFAGILPGTFDPIDLACYALPYLLVALSDPPKGR